MNRPEIAAPAAGGVFGLHQDRRFSVRIWLVAFLAILSFGIADAVMGTKGHAETRRIALKSGESVELHAVYYILNCKSIMVGLPQIEILEGPQQVTLNIKEGKVLPRSQNCANRVPGGTMHMTAKDVSEPMEAKITYRVKYKIKDGERQIARTYLLSLFP